MDFLYDGTDEDYDRWFAAVNKLMLDALSITVEDLPDRNWRDHYEDGTSPRDALDYEYDGNWQDPEAMLRYL